MQKAFTGLPDSGVIVQLPPYGGQLVKNTYSADPTADLYVLPLATSL